MFKFNKKKICNKNKFLRFFNTESFLSERSKRRKPSATRELMPLSNVPGMISLGVGMPNGELFPIVQFQFTVSDEDGKRKTINVCEEMVKKGLQYSPSYGMPETLKWLNKLHENYHGQKKEYDWSICVTNGSQDGLSKIFDMLLNEGDTLLTEDPTYSGALSALECIKPNLFGIECDDNGLKTSLLQETLANWNTNPSTQNLKFPKVLYCIPTGQNPKGCTLSLERREELIKIAEKYDLVIIEDDPYFFLSYNERPPSLFSLDKVGRVIRCDSFSKVLSSGIRMGYVSGGAKFVEKIQLDLQSTCLHAGGLSQVVFTSLLNEWGVEGFEKHVKRVQSAYKLKLDQFLSACDKHLTGLATWSSKIDAGMFVWLKLNGVEDSDKLIKENAVNKKVLLLPGKSFSPNKKPSPYCRASFSLVNESQMNEALTRLKSLLTDQKK